MRHIQRAVLAVLILAASTAFGADAVAFISNLKGEVALDGNPRPPLLLTDDRSVDALAESLATDFAGLSMPVLEIFERDSIDKLYVARNYKDALMRLESSGRVVPSRPASERRKGTLADDFTITFARLPGSGAKVQASRSTLDRRAAVLPTSASARPTA